MGFCNNSFAKVWEVKDGKGNYGEARISISKKNKETDEYDTTFQGFVRLVGKANEVRPAEGDRIKIVSCDVTNFYSKEKKTTYWNPVIYEWESVDGGKPNTDFNNIPDDAAEDIPW